MPEEKILDRIRKLLAIADGAANLENASPAMQAAYEAESLAAAAQAQKLLKKYNLERSQVQIQEDSPEFIAPVMGRTVVSNPFKRTGARKASKNDWWRELANIIAPSQFCRVSYNIHAEDDLTFYGLDTDRELAIFTFNKFAEIANNLVKIELKKAKKLAVTNTTDFKTGVTTDHPEWQGNDVFENSYHYGFRTKLEEFLVSDFDHNPFADKLDQDVNNYWNLQVRLDGFQSKVTLDFPSQPVVLNTYAIKMGEKVAQRVGQKIEKQNGNLLNGNGKADAIARQSQIVKEREFIGECILAADDSGSMSGEKIRQAKSGAVDFAYQMLAKGFKVGLLKFGYNAKHLIDPQKEVSQDFISAIEQLRGQDGSTNMADAIKLGITKLSNNKVKRTLCLVTDGQPDSKDKTLQAAHEAKILGIEIACVGVDDAEEDFLKQLASRPELALKADNISEGMKRITLLLTA